MKWIGRIGLTFLLLLASLVAGTADAGADRASMAPPPVLDIHVTPEGFSVPGPNPRPGGPVTFRVTAEGAHGYWWTAYRLLNGTTLEQFAEWMEQSNSPDPDVALPALRRLYENVDYSGGAKVYPGRAVELTQTLRPGVYYFGSLAIPGPQADMAPPSPRTLAANQPSPFGWLEVTEEFLPAAPPAIKGVIYMGNAGGRNFMVASRAIPESGRFLVRNDSSQPQEAVFLELRPGATDRDIQDYFDAELEGRPLPPRPFYDSVGGMLALSPGNQLILKVDLPRGRYGVFSWLRTPDSGIESCMLGMHRVVAIR